MKTLYWILLSVQIITTAVTTLLHMFDLVHFAATLKYIQTLIICYLVFFILIEVMNLKFSKATSRMYLIGTLVILFCISYDMVNYHRERFYGSSTSQLTGMSSIGVIVFIFILVGSFFLDLTQKMMQDAERSFLIKSAYTDELTQIHNRRYCMEYMQKMEENKLTGYTVICFDVNNLKTINDTFGHAKGDVLIKSAAEVIAETFEQYGIVARMGGDEFIAIIETYDGDKVKELMEKFQENVLKKNRTIDDLEISIARGYASGTVQKNDIEKIYQEADNLMYENKKQMKAARNS